ncbi:hypothetical protein ACWEQL_39940 [Kitasatospora sp. NPDC004240]
MVAGEQRPAGERDGPAERDPLRPAAAAPQPVPVQHVPAGAADALDRADGAVDRLLDSGRDPGDILVLTVGGAHPWAQHELSFGEARYWAQLAEGGDVFYADAFFADALPSGEAPSRVARREVVVLVVNEGRAGSGRAAAGRAAEAFDRALGHATALVVVCGDAGPAVTKAVAAGTPAGRPVSA